MPYLPNFTLCCFAIFWKVNMSSGMSGWMQPSYPGENYEVTTSSSGNFENNYYGNSTEYNLTYYGNAGEYGPVVFYGNGNNGFNSAYDEEMNTFKVAAVTFNIGLVVIIVLIIVCCFCVVFRLVNKSRDHGPENHLNSGRTQGYTESNSNIPMATVLYVAENNTGLPYQDTNGLSCDNNNKTCHTGFSGHDNSHTVFAGHDHGHTVSCVSTTTDVPSAVAVG